jgi:antitoxin component YwqK of YwqJK toxin-antitoxin module
MKKQILIEKYIEPSEIKINSNYTYESWFDRNDDLHSFMGHPASVCYYSNGQIIGKQWYKKGVIHRDGDLPAYIIYYSNGQISYQAWYKNGIRIK